MDAFDDDSEMFDTDSVSDDCGASSLLSDEEAKAQVLRYDHVLEERFIHRKLPGRRFGG